MISKKLIHSLFLMLSSLFFANTVTAQPTVLFTGRDNMGGYVQLHHVVVENLTQEWTETLFFPDTILLMTQVNIPEHQPEGGFALWQNVPNPFDGATEVSLTISEAETVLMGVVDISGRKIMEYAFDLDAGIHTFRILVNNSRQCLLTAKSSRHSSTIKMLNNSTCDVNHISHIGNQNLPLKYEKSDDLEHQQGDLMRVVGYYLQNNGEILSSDTLEQTMDESCIVTLIFNLGTPKVVTGNCMSVAYHEAACEGLVIDEGASSVTTIGICWSTSDNPTLSDYHTTENFNSNAFTDTLTNLTSGTTYWYRAYATNANGTAYGGVNSLNTLQNALPMLSTMPTTNNIGYSVSSGGIILDNGGLPIIDRGVCWSIHSNLLSETSISSTDIVDTFTCNLTGLTPGTHYYMRAYATNTLGTGYGNLLDFTTESFVNSQMYSLSDTTNKSIKATCHINTSNPSYQTKGFCWGTSPNPTLSDQFIENTSTLSSAGYYTSTITGLAPNTTYYVRSFVTNVMGTNYSSNQLIFTTHAFPIVETDSVIVLTDSEVMTGGTIVHSGNLPITEAGVCWSTHPNPTTNDSHYSVNDTIGHFQVTLTNLSTDSIFYLRAYATNSFATSYGENYIFRARATYGQACSSAPTVIDYDGNVYNTVQIGTQCWMAENVKTTHFADGTVIPLGTTPSTTFAYLRFYPNGDSTNVGVYGYLYSWPTAMHGASSSNANPSGIQGICPNGWHLPSNAEWQTMKSYLSSQSQYCCGADTNSIGKSLASNSSWGVCSSDCSIGNLQLLNNETGFNAYPAGGFGVVFYHFGDFAKFWSTTAFNSSAYGGNSYIYFLQSCSDSIYPDIRAEFEGISIRCIKN